MKGFDFAAGLSNPAYIAGISGLNPLAGKQLVQQAALQREQKQENRAEEKHNFEKTKFLREEEAAKAMLQQFGDVDFDNPQKALKQLQEKNVPADAALLLIHKANEIKNAKEGVDIQRGQLGVQQGQLGVSQGQLGLNEQELGLKRQELAAKLAGGIEPEEKFKREQQLRKELEDSVGSYEKIKDAYTNIQELSKLETGASDMGMVYAYIKLLDPNSTVGPGEKATAEKAGGIPENIRGQINTWLSQGSLSPKARNDLKGAAKTLYGTKAKAYKKKTGEIEKLAQNYKLDTKNVILNPYEEEIEPQVNSQSAPGGNDEIQSLMQQAGGNWSKR